MNPIPTKTEPTDDAASGRPFADRAGRDRWLEADASANDEYSVARHGRLHSASLYSPGLSIEGFLHAAEGQERFYWRDGRSGIAFAGVGVAAHMKGYGRGRVNAIQRQARDLFAHAETDPGRDAASASALAEPRLFGGFSFRESFAPDVVWTGFHPAHFILPHYQLVARGGQSWLTINALLPAAEQAAANLPQLRAALDIRLGSLQAADGRRAAHAPPTHARAELDGAGAGEIDYPLSFAEWAGLIDAARRTIAATPLRKVVLSRIAQIRAPRPFDILPALDRLRRLYPTCSAFLFEPQPGHGFLGATPELLLHLQGARLETMALAGSIQRGRNAAEDDALARALLTSAKNRDEHAYVVAALRRRLAPLASRLAIPGEPTVIKLENIQHLYTPIRASLRRSEGVLPLVDALHPTPAMGGTPRQAALDFIHTHEPTLRGWYAAPIGWIDRALDGAFAVAIRSAVVQRERAWAYAGAGILADSVAQDEWDETEWKFRPIVNALLGGPP